MAISNFGELKSAVTEWLAKSNLSSRAADFITLAQTRIYYGSKDPVLGSEPVRVREMQTFEAPSTTVGASVIEFSIPTRHLETIQVVGSYGGEPYPLQYITPEEGAQLYKPGEPALYYTFLNGRMYAYGTLGTIGHHYYQSFADFSADTDTNALLTKAPGLFLYGAMIEAAMYQRDDASAQRAYRMYVGTAAALNDVASNPGDGPLIMRKRA